MKLYNGDCLEVMDQLIKDGIKVDAIITDPPYGITCCKWDSVIPLPDMWARLKQLVKPNAAVVLFGSEPFSSMLRVSNLKDYKYDWVWNKRKVGNPFNGKWHPQKIHEIISVFGAKKYFPQMVKIKQRKSKIYSNTQITHKGFKSKEIIYNYKYPQSILDFSNAANNRKLHPTQKPVALMEYLIKTYTNEGDTVLDFAMGSGTTGVACKNLNRHFIGIELDKDFFKIAQERLIGNPDFCAQQNVNKTVSAQYLAFKC